jgi:hypothetical protein
MGCGLTTGGRKLFNRGAVQYVLAMWRRRWLAFTLFLCAASPAGAGEWSGYIGGDVRVFTDEAVSSQQHDVYPGLVADLEYRAKTQDGIAFVFAPFVRGDRYDSGRSHVDIRELLWTRRNERYQWRAGIGRVFWGVTEFHHLVDVVNQTDFVEDLDGEAKLGQPMVGLSFEHKWGVLAAYVLPGFRVRTFPGTEGRFRFAPPVDADKATFEASNRRLHVDFALRWSASGVGWDVGLSRFEGTSREPRYLLGIDAGGQMALLPHYDLIEQTGVDAQTTLGNWLWKFEAINRSGGGERFNAYTGGFEYTLVGIIGGRADIGVIAEAMYDERANHTPNFFQDDIGLGLRIGFNDAQNSQILFGVVVDRDYHTEIWKLEGSRRLGDKWKISIEGRRFKDVSVNDVVFGLRQDSYLQLGLARYL